MKRPTQPNPPQSSNNTPRKTAVGDWMVESSKIAYETPFLRVRSDTVKNNLGKDLTYGVVETHRPSVFIVATNSNTEILLQLQYRYPIDAFIWEVPAGFNDGEEPLAAAQRELLEETGLQSDDWTHLHRMYTAIGIANIGFDVFLARNTRLVSDQRDENEQIVEQRFFDIATIEAMVVSGEIISAMTLAAVQLARIHIAQASTD